MKQNIIITSVIAILALVSCVTGPKTVEFPVVETPATTSIIIEKVELTDTSHHSISEVITDRDGG